VRSEQITVSSEKRREKREKRVAFSRRLSGINPLAIRTISI
jgi:hypothetical protein